MSVYLGEKVIDTHTTKYAMYSRLDWINFWFKQYQYIDGEHHKTWLIDQIARILKGTPIILKIAEWSGGKKEERFSLGEPPQKYWDWIKNDSEYDFGIAP